MKTLKSIFLSSLIFFISCYRINAQIFYTDVIPDTAVNSNGGIYHLDLNNDGITDYDIKVNSASAGVCSHTTKTNYYTTILPLNNNAVLDDANSYPKALNQNVVVKSGSTVWGNSSSQILYKHYWSCTYNSVFHNYNWVSHYVGNWSTGTDKYVGLKLKVGTNTYYGWLRMNPVGSTSFTIKDYAYDSTPNHKILTGATSGARIAAMSNTRHHKFSFPVTSNPSGAENNFYSNLSMQERTLNTPCIKSQQTIGGSNDEDVPGGVLSIGGGSYVVCGGTFSTDGVFSSVPTTNDEDAYLVKYNPSGHIVWVRTYGGTGFDYFQNVIQTNDGGFIAAGVTSSNDGDVSGNHGGDEDIWVVKLSASGNIQWQKCFGGSGDDIAVSILQSFSGAYALAGLTNSNDGDVSGNHGDYDAWIAKFSNSGNLFWQHCYGGSDYDDVNGGMKQSSFGSLIFTGNTYSSDGDITGQHGGSDYWVVKINLFGSIVWEKTLGGSIDDYQRAIATTTDGNIVVGGVANSTDGDVNGTGLNNSWMIKLNPNSGAIIWNKHYDTPVERGTFGIIPTSDGGLIELGTTGIANDYPTWDAFVSKWDANGNELWNTTFGGSDGELLAMGFENANGTLIVQGKTHSTDGDVTNNHGGDDVWILKLSSCGNQRMLNDDSENNSVSFSTFPNPFSNSTTISFFLEQSQNVSLKVFDVNGRLITTLADKIFKEGENKIEWNAEKVNAGIYFLKLETCLYSENKKLIVTK